MGNIKAKGDLINRVNKLIQRRGTGSPDQLAARLKISKATLFRLIDTMKELGAPIVYDFLVQTYTYEYEVDFMFGFVIDGKLQEIKDDEIKGGYSNMRSLGLFLNKKHTLTF
jgi:hypothetical protein